MRFLKFHIIYFILKNEFQKYINKLHRKTFNYSQCRQKGNQLSQFADFNASVSYEMKCFALIWRKVIDSGNPDYNCL